MIQVSVKLDLQIANLDLLVIRMMAKQYLEEIDWESHASVKR